MMTVSISGASRRLAFGFEIYHVPDSADYMPDTEFTAYVDGEIVVAGDAHAFQTCCGLSYDFYLAFSGKVPPFVDVHTYGHDHFIEHCKGALQDVQVACRERIE